MSEAALTEDEVSAPSAGALSILVVRPDRIGDVILSTPVFSLIKQHYPESHLTVLVRAQVAPLVRGLPSVDRVIIYDPEGTHAGSKGFFNLVTEFKNYHFKIAIVLQSHWKIAAAIFFAGVRHRIGPLSKLHSFLFYNRGVRQRRSQVEMHETDYNLQLLRKLGIRVGTRGTPISVSVSEEAKGRGRKLLEEKGWKTGTPLVLIHPGMGGSALNWPENHYIELIRTLIRNGRKVLVSAGPTEGELLERVGNALGSLREKAIFYRGGKEPDSIEEFAGILFWASVVVAPSTGPLHIAVALKKPVMTFFPPIRVQSALRWGPYLQDESMASVLVPEVYCGQEFHCLGHMCNYFPCMKGLTVSQALEQLNLQLSRADGQKSG